MVVRLFKFIFRLFFKKENIIKNVEFKYNDFHNKNDLYNTYNYTLYKNENFVDYLKNE